MRRTDAEMPCGNCDIGIYCERAFLNKIARKFGALEENERLEQMPKCKVKKDSRCEGASDFHNALIELDKPIEGRKAV